MARTPQLLNIYSGTDATGNATTIVAEDMTTAASIYKSTNDVDPIILQRTKANVQCALPDVYVTFVAEAYNTTTSTVDKACKVTPGTYTVLAGTQQIFTAIAADGYEFVKWQIDGKDVLDDEGEIVSADVYRLTIPEGTGSRVTIRGCFKLVD
jgi:hypothetical protein